MSLNVFKTAAVKSSLLALTLALSSTSIAAEKLKLAHFIPPQHFMHHKVFVPLAKDVAKASNGELSIKIYPSGSLGKGPVKQFKRAVDGTADITFGVHSYSPNLFPKSMLSVQVGASENATDATSRIWNIYEKHLASEYTKVKTLGVWAASSVVIISRDKPVRTMADLKGMKVTSSGSFISPLLEAWGAVPVPMKLPEIYNALATGVVDAVAIAPSAIYKPWSFGEVAKYVTVGVPGTINTLFLVMNKKKWDKLPAAEQQTLDSLTGRDFSIKAAQVFQTVDEGAVEKARNDANLTVIEFSEQEQAKLYEVGSQVSSEHLKALQAKGIDDAEAAYAALNQ